MSMAAHPDTSQARHSPSSSLLIVQLAATASRVALLAVARDRTTRASPPAALR